MRASVGSRELRTRYAREAGSDRVLNEAARAEGLTELR
jgi:hypothetical protein